MLGTVAQCVQGYNKGKHGDSSVPVWSSAQVGGVPILQLNKAPNESHNAIHRDVVQSAGDVILKKGYTNWACLYCNSCHEK